MNPEEKSRSAAIVSDGSYDVPEGLISSFPVRSATAECRANIFNGRSSI